MKAIEDDKLTSFFRVELLASLERLLCFCHTGSTAVFATSLMGPLCLSKSAVKDGFPMLQNVFYQLTILSAAKNGIQVDPRKWPLKDGYPAIASKKTQVLTYSLSHFMVRLISIHIYKGNGFLFVSQTITSILDFCI